MSHKGREIEIKLPAGTPAAARARLRRAGFAVSKRRVLERNVVFDTPEGTLRASDTLLRVRYAAGLCILTYKGSPSPGKHKDREEIETAVADGRALEDILERMGLRPVFRYEKYRTEFRQNASGGLATLDETPIGVYLELEGAPRWIDSAARRLGFEESDYITASYGRLYLDWCAGRGMKPGHMEFPAAGA